MRQIIYVLFFSLTTFISCRSTSSDVSDDKSIIEYQEKKTTTIGDIHIDNQFDGARYNGFSKINDSTFQVTITPENKPINKSAWYAFKIWSDKKQTIHLQLNYPEFEHRYIPKKSKDGKNWENILEKETNSSQFKIEVSPEPLWISGQEIISSKDIENWIIEKSIHPSVEHKVIGKSTLGRSMHLMTIKSSDSKQKMLIIGRQHPPEIPGGTLSLYGFIEEILRDDPLSMSFREKVELYVFPNLNPDGVDLGHWRHNANGVDLNRDWKEFKQKETQVVRDYVKQFSTKDWIYGIDFHTSFSGPYLLVMDSMSQRSTILTDHWIDNIKELRNDSLDIRPRSQDLPYCYNWMINELQMEAVTYEEGDEIDRQIVKERAGDYAKALMSAILESNN